MTAITNIIRTAWETPWVRLGLALGILGFVPYYLLSVLFVQLRATSGV